MCEIFLFQDHHVRPSEAVLTPHGHTLRWRCWPPVLFPRVPRPARRRLAAPRCMVHAAKQRPTFAPPQQMPDRGALPRNWVRVKQLLVRRLVSGQLVALPSDPRHSTVCLLQGVCEAAQVPAKVHLLCSLLIRCGLPGRRLRLCSCSLSEPGIACGAPPRHRPDAV